MPHKNFEHYADQRLMNGSISDIFIKIFEKNVAHTNPHLKILDYGCGDGKYFLFLCRYFEKNAIFGLEVSEKRIIRCKRIGWDNVFKIETFKQFPFDDNFFDVIIFDQVIEHISLKEIDFCLSELQRVLKKEGKMILITPNYPIKRVYDFMNAILKKDWRRFSDDPTHISKYNFGVLERKLNKYFCLVMLYPTGGFFYRYIKKKFWSHKIIGIAIK